MSSLRSGSHMVRSMLRDEPTIRDMTGEHVPLTPADIEALSAREETSLVPLKYGHRGFTRHCLDVAAADNACALILHRRDAKAQARSLATAQRYGNWVQPVTGVEPVRVSASEVEALRHRNERDLFRLTAWLRIPHVVLAYEDISTEKVTNAVSQLLGRAVVVREPATVKLSG
jgi:LPS sulfotransferase NodH